MVAECQPIAHGASMTDYCTRNNRAQIVYTKNLSEGLPPLGMWSEMQINMAKYAQKFSKKPVKKPILRFEVSPSLEESKGWTYDDWNRFAIRFLNELVKASQRTSKNGKKKYGIDLSRAQIFACLHYDSKSGIPHLHILINRIDLDGNLVDDSFIGKNCVKAAHAINVAEGWKLPEDIHDENVKEITDACYKVLSEMRAYSWNDYANRIKALGYDVKVQKDKDGVMHGYTIMKGNSRYKSSILGVGRDLMLKNLRGTWMKFHKPTQVKVNTPSTGVGMSKLAPKPVTTGQTTRVQSASNVHSSQSSASTEKRAFVLWDNNGKEEKTSVSNHIYDVISKNVELYDDTPEERENCIKVAILLFAGYVDGATSIAESCGGGGSPGGGWGRDKDEDEDARARRAAQKASWLCKPMGRTYKRK